MFERLEISRLTQALANHAAARQAVISGNVAHADTPGYRAREVEDFATHLRRLTQEPAAPPDWSPPTPAQPFRPTATRSRWRPR